MTTDIESIGDEEAFDRPGGVNFAMARPGFLR
jgi:hypothetical protein